MGDGVGYWRLGGWIKLIKAEQFGIYRTTIMGVYLRAGPDRGYEPSPHRPHPQRPQLVYRVLIFTEYLMMWVSYHG